MAEIKEGTAKKQQIGTPFPKGVSGNPNGRPKGTTCFSTDFNEVVHEIAEEEGITVSEARKTLLKVAYKEAKKGNFNFSRDLFDRYYGKPTQPIDVEGTLNIGKIEKEIQDIIDDKDSKAG